MLAAFTEKTGIETEYISDRNAEVTVQTMIAAGNPPDIQSMPRPGAVAELARDGVIQALTSGDDPIVPPEMLQENYAQSIIDQSMVDGEIYGILHAPNSKSTIWYRTDTFADPDLEIPETWDGLLELVDIPGRGRHHADNDGRSGWLDADRLVREYLRAGGGSLKLHQALRHACDRVDG